MATKTLFADATLPTVLLSNAGELTVGTHYVPLVDVTITHLRWYRGNTTAAHKPTALTIWDKQTGAIVYAAGSIPDDGAVGWQDHTVTSTVIFTAGHAFVISQHRLVSTAYAYVHTADVGGTTYPLSVQSAAHLSWTFGTGNPFPGASGGTDSDWVLVGGTFDYDPDQVPIDSGGLNNALSAWLSTTDGTHADSAPLQDHTTLATVNTNTAAVKADADDWAFGLGAAAHGYYADVKTLIGNIKTITDTLPTPIAQLTSIVLDHYTADIALILAQIDTALSNLGAQSTDLSGTAGSAVGALSGRTGFPAAGWSMSAEEDFEDAIAFVAPADAYVLSITSYQDTQPANESPAGLWLPRLGWWCVLNGTLASQRQFVDFQEMLLDAGGRRMPGCAIQLRPGTLATVQAWVLA